MHSLDLNLASRPFRNNAVLWVGHSTAALLLIVFTVWNVTTYRAYAQRLGEQRSYMQEIERETGELSQRDRVARAGIHRFDLNTLVAQTARANEVIEWKAFSWTRLFNRLASIQPWKVKMISIRPVFQGRRDEAGGLREEGGPRSIPVLIEGLARDFESFLEMQGALLEDPHFGRLVPERLHRADSQEILFQLHFDYFPDENAPEVEEQAGAPQVAADAGTTGEAEPEPSDPDPDAEPVEVADEQAPLEIDAPRKKLPPAGEPLDTARPVEDATVEAAATEQTSRPAADADTLAAPVAEPGEQPPASGPRDRGRRGAGKAKRPRATPIQRDAEPTAPDPAEADEKKDEEDDE